jgi:cytochrome b involved in lipid metabolism
MLDVGGQDATEAFEDVGHSDEARETLEPLKVGILKRKVCPIIPSSYNLPLSPSIGGRSHADGQQHRPVTQCARLPSPVLWPRQPTPAAQPDSAPVFMPSC